MEKKKKKNIKSLKAHPKDSFLILLTLKMTTFVIYNL